MPDFLKLNMGKEEILMKEIEGLGSENQSSTKFGPGSFNYAVDTNLLYIRSYPEDPSNSSVEIQTLPLDAKYASGLKQEDNEILFSKDIMKNINPQGEGNFSINPLNKDKSNYYNTSLGINSDANGYGSFCSGIGAYTTGIGSTSFSSNNLNLVKIADGLIKVEYSITEKKDGTVFASIISTEGNSDNTNLASIEFTSNSLDNVLITSLEDNEESNKISVYKCTVSNNLVNNGTNKITTNLVLCEFTDSNDPNIVYQHYFKILDRNDEESSIELYLLDDIGENDKFNKAMSTAKLYMIFSNSNDDDNNSGDYSFSQGKQSIAKGFCSFATGENSIANGNYSIAMGKNCQTTEEGEIALGKFNETDGNTIFSIGNGTSDEKRSNALSINTDGVTTIKAISFEDKAYGSNKDGGSYLKVGSGTESSRNLATVEYVNNHTPDLSNMASTVYIVSTTAPTNFNTEKPPFWIKQTISNGNITESKLYYYDVKYTNAETGNNWHPISMTALFA